MKWPNYIALVRHGESAYNALRAKKNQDPDYLAFLKEFEANPDSPTCKELALVLWERYALTCSDYETPLSERGVDQAFRTGMNFAKMNIKPPDVVLVSPYNRTRETWDSMLEGGFAANGAKVVIEDRIREQEHGLSLLYSDWRIFHVMHPEQRRLRKQLGPYWYQYPQGESVSQVRERQRSVATMLIREYAGKNVLLITHHLTILSIRANYERLSPEQFIHLDENEKPINCGVTVYRGHPELGNDGKLVLEHYNKRLY